MNWKTQLMRQAQEFRTTFKIKNTISATKIQKSLIDEEWSEFHEAYHFKSEECQAKELGDVVYTCYQYACNKGWDLDEILDRIHKSNMSKLDENGEPIFRADGKVLKSQFYSEPILIDLL